ncbi:(deoxy)nucleoside triphosphate pyrophosphohydrolase [Brevibacterium aurantiacum]|uniref:8-oxo-dGTP diphosphatase n=1 Tax=Brevibacterium aurantiacum TaxID=273384 RepID=A0A2A3YX30_BREAU|nr:(deoxy)nucleoside triphosphate pyrophosphohydrolase [Brevibacterium aurantiacum]PCC43890.1 8-oxo-dGTP diphosphatase MutT [Brevibacterium aurantiacum]PCC48160.1 8-oxo-dGTP diphosphatase MutT [Brevibacterium aurantiacum]
MKKEINVVGAVVTNDGKILSARRSESMSLPGMWEFPGGKIEPGETPRAALVREMQEELLCTVEIGDEVASTRYEYDFGVVTLTTFYATLIDGKPQLTEHSEIRWIDAADLNSVEWAPADVPAVETIMAAYSTLGR